MKPCRLKIITAIINPDEKESDIETIHYVSQNKNYISQYQDNNKTLEEEEKNLDIDLLNEEEDAIIIRDKNDIKKKKIKIPKEKVYLIDRLFSPNNSQTKRRVIQNKSADTRTNKDSENQKLRAKKKINESNKKSGKKSIYRYKWDYNYDNKINTMYNSKKSSITTTPKRGDGEKFFSPPKNPFAFNFYKTNQQIDSNITDLFDYKKKIKELLDKEPKTIENRNNIVKENDKILQKLIKENNNLNYELGFEINREDELKGEIIILKNQHEILFNLLGQEEKKIKQYQDIIKHKSEHEKIKSNKQNDIFNYYNNLNECLTKGEILIVTKPDLYNRFNYINSKNIVKHNNNPEENNNNEIINGNEVNNNNNIIKNENNKEITYNNELRNVNMNLESNLEVIKEIDINDELDNYLNYDIITLLLKGYFINMNLTNIDDILNKIWIFEKPIQTFESLTEEILLLIDNYIGDSELTFINEHNRNILMNYFYSFCHSYNYMTMNEFRSLFNDKLGYFIEYNENFLINKLYKYCNGKLSEFIKVIQEIDINKTGKIDVHDFIRGLKEKNIIFNKNNIEIKNEENRNLIEQNDIIDIIQLLIIDMKRKKINLVNNIGNNSMNINNENNFDNKDKDNNFENAKKEKEENNINIYELYYTNIINIIINNCKNEMPLYKGIIKKYLVDNNIDSMIDFMDPLLLNHDIIINKGINRYIRNQTFNNFLITNNVIGENEIFLLPFNDDSLIEINNLVIDIDQAKPLLNNFEENKEKFINEIINDISDN